MPTTNNTTWVSPRTWSTGELITQTIMNAHVRDQLTALKTPAGGYSVINEASDYTTNSTSFGDIDSTDMSLTFTTGGGDVLIFMMMSIISGTLTARTYFDIHESVSGGRLGGDDGLIESGTANTSAPQAVVLCYRATGLSAAQHTFKVQWKVSGGTTTGYAGAATAGHDTHPVFWAFEI